MKNKIEFFFDFRSPYSYLVFTQLRQMDATLVLRPVDLLIVMDKVGNIPTSLTCAAKGRYARIDLERWAKRYGVVINPSDMNINDSDACSRAVLAAGDAEEAQLVTLALYQTIWSDGKTVANSADVLAALRDKGFDVASIAERIDKTETIKALDSNTSEAAERGVFGSPTMFVGEAMFFGNDRLDFVREELTRLKEAA